MGLFNTHITLADSGFLRGYSDFHAHLLPGFDDGIKDFAGILPVLSRYEAAGVIDVWFTPHVMEFNPLRTQDLKDALAAVKRSYRGPVSLHVAGQYLLDSLFAERLQSADLLCLEHRRVLVDAFLYNPPQQFRELLTRTLSQGYVPVLAHPERYGFLSVEDCLELKETGVLFLLDIASLVSFYGEDVRERADELLRRDLYALSGTGVQNSLSLDTLLEYKFKSKIIKHIPR